MSGPTGAPIGTAPDAPVGAQPDGDGTTQASGRPSPAMVAPSGPVPGIVQVVREAAGLVVRSPGPLGVAAFAIALQLMGALGPFVVLALVVADRVPDLFDLLVAPGGSAGLDPQLSAVAGPLSSTLFIGLLAIVALTVEARIVAVALVGAAAAGTRLSVREALRRSRQVYWLVVVATVAVQLPISLLGLLLDSVLGPLADTIAGAVLSTAVTTIAIVPFVYLEAAIVLGGAAVAPAIGRSIAVARRRWRLALVLAALEAVAQTVLVLAATSGYDAVAGVSASLGLGTGSGAGTWLAVVLALLGTAAIGALLAIVAVVATAPQAVAFVDLTGTVGGLDPARDRDGARPVRWLSWPMAAGIAASLVLSFAGVAAAMEVAG